MKVGSCMNGPEKRCQASSQSTKTPRGTTLSALGVGVAELINPTYLQKTSPQRLVNSRTKLTFVKKGAQSSES